MWRLTLDGGVLDGRHFVKKSMRRGETDVYERWDGPGVANAERDRGLTEPPTGIYGELQFGRVLSFPSVGWAQFSDRCTSLVAGGTAPPSPTFLLGRSSRQKPYFPGHLFPCMFT